MSYDSASRPAQLHMLWPAGRSGTAAERLPVALPTDYELRTFEPADAAAYLALMQTAGFTDFGEAHLSGWLAKVLPDGFFLIVHRPTGRLAATAGASHCPDALLHPYGGELGWVAGSLAHAGRGLGRAVCATALNRFLSAGYRRIYLRTDDWRLPALKIYLGLGFQPFLYAPDMPARWATICEKLHWPYSPEAWPSLT
jgi:mycothiol synthase